MRESRAWRKSKSQASQARLLPLPPDSNSFFFSLLSLFDRTNQLLEIFEESPDDDANWGETIDMAKKLYETESSSSSSSGEGQVEMFLTLELFV